MAQASRAPVGHRDRPDLVRRPNGSLQYRLTLPRRLDLADGRAYEDEVPSVIGESQVRQISSVVFVVAGQAPGVELGTRCKIDVADAALVEHPRDCGTAGRCGQVLGERV